MRPRWHNDHPLLAAVAAHLHRQRVDGYPALVEAGRLAPHDAITGIRVTAAIARGWAAIAARDPEPADLHDGDTREGAWPFERIATLDRLVNLTRAAADANPGCDETAGIADAVATLRWYETADPSARMIADINRAIRAMRPAVDDRRAPVAAAPRWRSASPGHPSRRERLDARPAPDLFIQGEAA